MTRRRNIITASAAAIPTTMTECTRVNIGETGVDSPFKSSVVW